MTVKNVLKITADLLGEKDVKDYLSGNVPDDSEYCKTTTALLKRCYDMVTDELACEYAPILYSEQLESKNGKIAYSAFTKNPLKILSVKDENGKKCCYKPFIDYLEVADGLKSVVYEYRPKIQTEDEEAIFSNYKTGEYTLIYGIAAEFCLERGRVNESEIWSNKYYQGLKGRLSERRNLKIPARRWF